MKLVTLETYGGERVSVNPELVQTIAAYNFFDNDMELPKELMRRNRDDLMEVDPDFREEANALRTSVRTLVVMSTGNWFEVKGTVEEVGKALG